MIPGSVSRVVEGTAVAGASSSLTLRGGEVFRLAGPVSYATINPPLGKFQNQVVWIIPVNGAVTLTAAGNIAVGIVAAVDRAVRLVWLKSTQKWYIENGV